MHLRLPALLAGLVLAAVALTGCSTSGGAADLGGVNDPGNRSPMLRAEKGEIATSGQMTVTALTADQFGELRHDGVTCRTDTGVTVCQGLRGPVSGDGSVQWTTYLAVPQTTPFTVSAEVGVAGTPAYDATATDDAVQGPYVQIEWGQIPSRTEIETDLTVSLTNGDYSEDCPATFQGMGRYDLVECTLTPPISSSAR